MFLILDALGAGCLAVVRHSLAAPSLENFVSAGVPAKNVWFLYRFDMPYASSLTVRQDYLPVKS